MTKQSTYGTSIINHNIRMELGLTMEEYAVMDLLMECYGKQPLNFMQYVADKTGMGLLKIDVILADLLLKNLITTNESIVSMYIISPTWLLHFDNDVDFNEFFSIFHSYGNRAESKERYAIVRKMLDKATLHDKAKQYIAWAIIRYDSNWHWINPAQVWLDPKKKRWENVLNPSAQSQQQTSKYGFL